MPDSATDRLRAHFTRHNRRVVFLAVVTALLAVIAWGLLGFAAYWFTLLFLSIEHPFDAQVPAWFFPALATGAAALCFFAWLLRRMRPDERARDNYSFVETLLDFLLVVPRMTLAISGTLSALIFLKNQELRLALALLQRIDREDALPLHAVPIEIAEESVREKILLALQITELVTIRKTDAGPALALHDEAVRALFQPVVRLRVR